MDARYQIRSKRTLLFSNAYSSEAFLGESNRIKEARGRVKQEINSHISMLATHDWHGLQFSLIGNDQHKILAGTDDGGELRYVYEVWVDEEG